MRFLGILGALSLGLGALLVFHTGQVQPSPVTAPEVAPAVAAPAPVPEPTVARVEEPTPPPSVPEQAPAVAAPVQAAPAVVSDRWKDMQVVDPVFEETRRTGNEEESAPSDDSAARNTDEAPSEPAVQNPYR